jgi:hypothetical protein
VPPLRIKVGTQGFVTTIGWRGDVSGMAAWHWDPDGATLIGLRLERLGTLGRADGYV